MNIERGFEVAQMDTAGRLTVAIKRIEVLRKSLSIALNMLAPNEPGDSRAVSDIFVAMAAVEAEDYAPEVLAVIDAAFDNQQRPENV